MKNPSNKFIFNPFFSVIAFLSLFIILNSCGRQGLPITKGTPGLHDYEGSVILGSNPKGELISKLCARDIDKILKETPMDSENKKEFKGLICGPHASQMKFYEFYCNIPKNIKHEIIISFMFAGYTFGNCG